MTSATLIPEFNAARELVTERVLRYPVELVFDAFTTAEHMKKWWGPAGFTNTFYVFEPRTNGTWKFTMHGPDGANYENEMRFAAVEKPTLVILDHIGAPEFRGIYQFEKVSPGETKVHWRMIFATEELFDSLRDFCKGKNEENMDRLNAELEKMTAARR